MIEILGVKRLALLSGLIVLNGILAFAIYGYVAPERLHLDRQARTASAQVSSTQAEVDRLRYEYDSVERQAAIYEDLKNIGYFSSQSREEARDRLAAFQRYSRVLSASYEIQPAIFNSDQRLRDAGHVMLVTAVTVDVDALDDIDFYNFLYLVNTAFPGHTSIENISISREHELSDGAIRQISTGTPVNMIKGSISFIWRTLIPDDRPSDEQYEIEQ